MTKYKNIGCIADDTPKAQEAMAALKAKYHLLDAKNKGEPLDLIIVLGGDGFMLHSLHYFMHLNIPLYGMNCGSIGFLLNNYDLDELMQRLGSAECTDIHPLKMVAIDEQGRVHQALAVNEIYLFRQNSQVAKIKITTDDTMRIPEMVGDGVIVATSAGSSAYNFSAGGPIIPLGSNILALTPISPFRPRRWRGALLPHTVSFRFDVLEAGKRPVSAVADFREFRNIVSVEVSEERSTTLKLLFDQDHSLEDRIIKEQFAY